MRQPFDMDSTRNRVPLPQSDGDRPIPELALGDGQRAMTDSYPCSPDPPRSAAPSGTGIALTWVGAWLRAASLSGRTPRMTRAAVLLPVFVHGPLCAATRSSKPGPQSPGGFSGFS